MAFTYSFPRPAVTLDVACFALGDDAPKVLLIQRGQAPYRGKWALPGGFLDMDEGLESGARRELLEETGIAVGPLWQIGAFGAVDRDPRGRTITVAFVAVHVGAKPPVRSGDDADAARGHPVRRLPPLAFDHRDVIADARGRLKERAQDAGRLASLLPRSFTTRELQCLHQFAAGEESRRGFAANARRAGLLKKTAHKRGRALLYTIG